MTATIERKETVVSTKPVEKTEYKGPDVGELVFRRVSLRHGKAYVHGVAFKKSDKGGYMARVNKREHSSGWQICDWTATVVRGAQKEKVSFALKGIVAFLPEAARYQVKPETWAFRVIRVSKNGNAIFVEPANDITFNYFQDTSNLPSTTNWVVVKG